MALVKALPTPFGVTAAYWRIASLQHDRGADLLQLVLAGYHNEEARRAGAHPLLTRTLTFDAAARTELSYGDLYDTIKRKAAAALPDCPFQAFAGGSDG